MLQWIVDICFSQSTLDYIVGTHVMAGEMTFTKEELFYNILLFYCFFFQSDFFFGKIQKHVPRIVFSFALMPAVVPIAHL